MTLTSREQLRLPPSSPVVRVARACAQAGGRALVVGGWVRDRLLGMESTSVQPRDMDLEVYGLTPAELEAVLAGFGRVRCVGRSFPVFLVAGLPLDVTLPRRDEPVSRGTEAPAEGGGARRSGAGRASAAGGSDVWAGFDPEQSFERASLGRDLRVNAMAWDPLSDELLDPHGGLRDLSARRLRATCPRRFGEDPLRGLRSAQLAARLELTPDAELRELCAAVDLDSLPGERLLEEFRKLLLRARRPSRALSFLDETRLLRFFPELEALRGVSQDERWHPEGDVWTHTLLVVDEAARERVGNEPRDLALMFAALCHDLGKADTTEEREGRVSAKGHSAAGAVLTEHFLARLRAPKALVAAVVALVRHHLAPREFVTLPRRVGGRVDAGPRAYRRLARALRAQGVDFELLARLARADHLGRCKTPGAERSFPAGDLFLERARAIEAEVSTHVDLVQGRHVLARGIEPGPAVGALLARCRRVQEATGWLEPDRILDRALSTEAEESEGSGS